MGLVQSKCHVNFALNPLRSYLEECQKNEIHIYIYTFQLHRLFSIICEVLMSTL